MTTLRDIEWEACLLEPVRDPTLEKFVRQEMGGVPPIVPYFEVCPWVVRSLMTINQYRVRLVHVSFALADLIGLVVSQENSCRFCYATQRVLMRAQGLPERRIRQLEDDFAAAQLDPPERAALEFARHIARCSPRPLGADRAALGPRLCGRRPGARMPALGSRGAPLARHHRDGCGRGRGGPGPPRLARARRARDDGCPPSPGRPSGTGRSRCSGARASSPPRSSGPSSSS
jgi:hypothetical protein